MRLHSRLLTAVWIATWLTASALGAEEIKAPESSGVPTLKVSFASGDVAILSGEKRAPAKKGASFSLNDHVILGTKESMIELEASDGTIFRMVRAGDLAFLHAEKDSATLEIDSGRIYVRRAEDGKVDWNLITPQARISQPTEGTVMIMESSTRVAIFAGSAKVSSADGKNTVTVNKNHETEVGTGGAPFPPSKSRMKLGWYKKGFPVS